MSAVDTRMGCTGPVGAPTPSGSNMVPVSAGGIDWPGLLRVGLERLRLEPRAFWGLTPHELQVMLGIGATGAGLSRARLAELAAAFPDTVRGET